MKAWKSLEKKPLQIRNTTSGKSSQTSQIQVEHSGFNSARPWSKAGTPCQFSKNLILAFGLCSQFISDDLYLILTDPKTCFLNHKVFRACPWLCTFAHYLLTNSARLSFTMPWRPLAKSSFTNVNCDSAGLLLGLKWQYARHRRIGKKMTWLPSSWVLSSSPCRFESDLPLHPTAGQDVQS